MFPKAATLLTILAIAAAFVFAPASNAAENTTVELNLVSLAAWTGQVDPSSGDAGPTGGAATLAAYWQNERAANPNTLVLGTGNSFGTSPPISNLFADEPAVFAMNAMGFDADALGNDNFDHGVAYLQRLLTIADFPFIAANLTNVDQNLSGVAPYRLFDKGGVKVAVIGVTDPRSPSMVFPGNFGTITVGDPYLAAYNAREQAAAAGAQVFVLITELGVTETPAAGPLLDLAKQLTGFDVILGNGDTANFSATINGAQVVAGMGRGQSYGRTTVHYDTVGKKVTGTEVSFVQPLASAVTPVASVQAMLQTYRSELASRLSETIATTASVIGLADACGNAVGRTCESITANVVADALRATYGGDVALMNAGAIRAGLSCPLTDSAADFCPPYSGLPAPITAGQVEAILPFNNYAALVTVSGAELKAMLENGVSMVLNADGRFPQVSGLCFWYDITRSAGSRVIAAVKQAADGACSGPAIDFGPSAGYRLVTNDFIAAGGDGYAKPGNAVTYRDRLDAVVSGYLEQQKGLAPRLQGRINCVGATCPVLISGAPLPLPATTGSGSSGGPTAATVRPPSTGDAGLR
ncbi:MAG: bifunctional UDP-sugar hydrolase/5'-nucleotidase [Dehalococcoidia bacterium]